jgi:hypothetical protein
VPYAFSVERVARKLDVARREHGYPQSVAPLELGIGAYVYVVKPRALQEIVDLRGKLLAQMATGPAI